MMDPWLGLRVDMTDPLRVDIMDPWLDLRVLREFVRVQRYYGIVGCETVGCGMVGHGGNFPKTQETFFLNLLAISIFRDRF